MVLYEVNRLASFANEDDFIKAMMGRSAKVTENEQARKQRELDGFWRGTKIWTGFSRDFTRIT